MRDDFLILFGIKQPQRVRFITAARRFRHPRDVGSEFAANHLREARSAFGVPDGIDAKLRVLNAERRQQFGQHFDDLGFDGRIVACAQNFRPNLIKLPEASLLTPFAAKLRAGVKQFGEVGQLPHLMLNVRAHDRRRVFRAQRQAPAFFVFVAAIRPGEHFLRDNVGFRTDAARKQFRMLKNRRADFLESVAAKQVAGDRLDVLKAVTASMC